MDYTQINTPEQFDNELKNSPDLFLLIYKGDSEQSRCAVRNLENIKNTLSENPVLIVDVGRVKDIHTRYHITSAPTLIEFKEGIPVRHLKGCHQVSALQSFFLAPAASSGSNSGKKQQQVIVYSTPSCSWCRTLKEYLKSHRVPFRDIDVSRDEKAAAEMVKRSGQQGVPQSIVNGQVIVGFDRNRIDRLLNIE